MSYPTVIYGSDGDQFTTGTKDFGIPLGTKMVFSGGDEYRWANVGGVILAVSLLNQAEAQASPFAVDEAPTTAAAAGATSVFVDVASALVVDDLKNGVLIDQTNGHTYALKNNTIADPTLLTLESPAGLITDLATGDIVRFIKSPYKDIIVKPASVATALLVGFTDHIIKLDEFGWIKSRGFTTVLVDASVVLVLAENADNSLDDAGAVGTETVTEQHVGIVYNIGTDTNADGEIYARLP